MGRWHAVDALDEALEGTKRLLLPVNAGFWLRLALVAMLATGLSGGNPGRLLQYGNEGGAISPQMMSALLAVLAVIVFVGLVFWYVSSVFRFVYIESILKAEVRMVEFAKEQAGNGLALFLFELAVVVGLLLVSFAVAFAAGMLFASSGSGTLMVFFIIVFVIAALAVAAAIIVCFWLINDFTVPIMYCRRCGIWAALKETVNLVSADFWQFAVFGGIALALGIAAAIPIFLVSFVLFLGVFLVLLFVGVGAYLGLEAMGQLTFSPLTVFLLIVGAAVLIVVQLSVVYVVTAITLPVGVFFRLYSLIFLSKADPSLGLTVAKKAAADGGDAARKDLLAGADDIEGTVKVY